MTGRERRVRKSINYAEPKLNTCVTTPSPLSNYSNALQQKDAQTRSSGAHAIEAHVVGRFSQDDNIPMVATERQRRKSRPRLPVDDDEESDGAQADEEPLAGSKVRTGLANVDTGTTRRRSAVVSSASRRSLIEDDEACRHSMLV